MELNKALTKQRSLRNLAPGQIFVKNPINIPADWYVVTGIQEENGTGAVTGIECAQMISGKIESREPSALVHAMDMELFFEDLSTIY